MHRFTLLALALALAACESERAVDEDVVPATEVTEMETTGSDAAVMPDEPAETAASSAVATAESTLLLDYEGRLEDGTVFDSGEGVTFRLPEMIDGFREEVVGMREDETKTFDLPPEKGYGAMGIPGVVPPNATLTFEVTVYEILD